MVGWAGLSALPNHTPKDLVKKMVQIDPNDWHFNKIKGEIWEILVKHMLEEAGFEVFEAGFEKKFRTLKNRDIKWNFDKKTMFFLKKTPDFIAIKDNNAYFIEAKFREKSDIDFNVEWIDEYPYGTYIFAFLNGYFKIIKIYNDTMKYGTYKDYEPFKNIDNEIIRKYIYLARLLFIANSAIIKEYDLEKIYYEFKEKKQLFDEDVY